MSAKINIETDDPKLAAALGVLIAEALQKAGFKNAQAKNVMIRQPETYPGWGKVSLVMEHVDGGAALTDKGERLPPELNPMHWIIPAGNDHFVRDILWSQEDLMAVPIVMSFYPDTCEQYEKDVDRFLTAPRPASQVAQASEGPIE